MSVKIDPKTFCLAPWVHTCVTTKKTLKPCCVFKIQSNNTYENFDDWWTGNQMANLRKDLVNGNQPAGCEECWTSESLGRDSLRQNYNNIFKSYTNFTELQANIKNGTKFFLENILIDNSVLFSARTQKIKNLIYIGSSCMYPANIEHPLKEDELLSGPLEPTNENYALAKLFGSRMTSSIAIEDEVNWRVFIASNLYGPNDHFNSEKSHLLAAIISKAVTAKENNLSTIEMWGDGSPRREFTHVEDFAGWIFKSSAFLEQLPYVLNTGIGKDYSVMDFYKKVLKTRD